MSKPASTRKASSLASHAASESSRNARRNSMPMSGAFRSKFTKAFFTTTPPSIPDPPPDITRKTTMDPMLLLICGCILGFFILLAVGYQQATATPQLDLREKLKNLAKDPEAMAREIELGSER